MKASVCFMKALLLAFLWFSVAATKLTQDSDLLSRTFDKADRVNKKPNKKIAMVVETLKDILQSVVHEEKEETAVFGEYMKWCDQAKDSTTSDVSETRKALTNARVLAEEQVSSIDSLNLFIKKTNKAVEETQDGVAQAVSIRQQANLEYTEESNFNRQSLRQIALAIKHVTKVNKQGGFLQNGIVKKLQVNEPGESSYVSGVMKGLRDRLLKAGQALKTKEDEEVKMHNKFLEVKGAFLKSSNDALLAKKIELTETTVKQATVTRTIGTLEEDLERCVRQAEEVAQRCSKAKETWRVRQADRTQEKAALREAVIFLTETSFEQLPLQDAENSHSEDEDSVVFAPSFLQAAGTASDESKRSLSVDADAFEGHMRKDTFKAVKTIVRELIDVHLGTQKDETSKRAKCAKTLASKEDDRDTCADVLAATKADIGKKQAEVVTLKDEVKKLYKSKDQLLKSLEDAGKVREQELGVYLSGAKDRALALKVLKQAKKVLEKFYAQKGNLLQGAGLPLAHGLRAGGTEQKGAVAAPPSLPRSSRKTLASLGAVGMIQNIIDDVAKETKDAANQEKEAAAAYEKEKADSHNRAEEIKQAIADRAVQKSKLAVQINTLKEKETEKTEELAALKLQLKALHDECDELLKHYGDRKKARAFEVSQLKDVMDILHGGRVD